MKTKDVLNKLMTLLSLEKEVQLTYAKLKDGTIVESPTFDVGEPVEVVSEDGSKSPAPDGEHELELRDESGNLNIIKIITKDGKIVERENVETESSEEEMKAEDVKVEPLPGESTVIGEDKKEQKMGVEEELPSGDGVEEEVEPLPGEPNSPFDMEAVDKKLQEMAYRIEELEKKMEDMGKEKMEEEVKEEEDVEEELPKLDGAPVEETKLNAIYKNKAKSEGNPQNAFLSRLYK